MSYCVLRARPELTPSLKSKPLWTETTLGFEIVLAASRESGSPWEFSAVQRASDGFLYILPEENGAHTIQIKSTTLKRSSEKTNTNNE